VHSTDAFVSASVIYQHIPHESLCFTELQDCGCGAASVVTFIHLYLRDTGKIGIILFLDLFYAYFLSEFRLSVLLVTEPQNTMSTITMPVYKYTHLAVMQTYTKIICRLLISILLYVCVISAFGQFEARNFITDVIAK
jgi:hypothetical protein